MSEKKPDWMTIKPLGKLIDERPPECRKCDYDFYEDCQEGCMKIKAREIGFGTEPEQELKLKNESDKDFKY